jgi:hypothetical protein
LTTPSGAVALLRSLPLEVFEKPQPDDAWARCALAAAGDEALVEAVCGAIAQPKVRINSSFLLHAPLELLARAWHLSQLHSEKRGLARRRIAEIGVRYAHGGPEIESRPRDFSDTDVALAELLAALRAGNAETVDGALLFLLPRLSVQRLRAAVADEILPCLGAAAHAPILLMMLAGPAGRFPGSGTLLRAPLRALSLATHRRLTWMDSASPAKEREATTLFDSLAAPPLHVDAPSDIASMLLAAERDGNAARKLAGPTATIEVGEAKRSLLRVAALAMLQDDPGHAPYGWTHCFTLPQAVLALADVASDPVRLIRVAATHVLGHRAVLGRTHLQYPYAPAHRMGPAVAEGQPAEAAAAAFHASGEQYRSVRLRLIENAAAHADAHVAKYTMACLTASDGDPEESSLYLAAAAYLAAWWRCN